MDKIDNIPGEARSCLDALLASVFDGGKAGEDLARGPQAGLNTRSNS
jgi:hypothetical protein